MILTAEVLYANEVRIVAYITNDRGCWLWIGPTRNGYGMYGNTRTEDVYVHRQSYRRHVGPIPNGLMVRHKCSTKRCFNPDHLLLGTATDNQRDKDISGRRPHQKYELTDEQVKYIHSRRGKAKAQSLADRHNIPRGVVYDIWNGCSYAHLFK